MYIKHTHPAPETPEAKTEALFALYRACVRKLCGTKPPWTLPQRGSPAPDTQ